jgi:NADPH:quinone reductase-like Zn-dependent oxidoreductase
MPLPELPAIPGREVAGVVDALGAGYALAQAAAAHVAIETRATVGKTVLVPEPGGSLEGQSTGSPT